MYLCARELIVYSANSPNLFLVLADAVTLSHNGSGGFWLSLFGQEQGKRQREYFRLVVCDAITLSSNTEILVLHADYPVIARESSCKESTRWHVYIYV